VLYLDPDIMVFGPLDEIFDALESNSIVLTPHITTPLPDDGRTPKEIDILKVGIFNLGFMGLARGESAIRLLTWWKERLYDKCLEAPLTGYAVDQGWISIVPCFFDDFYILRKPGYNVAYWNLHERNVDCKGDSFSVNGTPLYFFHFSGFHPGHPERLSKFQNRFHLSEFADLRRLFFRYREALLQCGYEEACKWPYSFGYYRNGRRISEMARGVYWALGTDTADFGDPFDAFCRKLFRTRYLRALFSERLVRAMLDKLAMSAWKLLIKRRSRSRLRRREIREIA
jgi:hypothetical protein